MYLLGTFLEAIAYILNLVLTLLIWLVFIRALISWVNPDPYNPIVMFLQRTTEPLLRPIRRYMPPMAVDLSPIILFLAIIFLQHFLVVSLDYYGRQLKGETGMIEIYNPAGSSVGSPAGSSTKPASSKPAQDDFYVR